MVCVMTIAVLVVEDEPVFLLFRQSPVAIPDAPLPCASVALLLCISPSTVIPHAKHTCQNLAIHSRGEAVHEANQLGLL
jgi:hypothetical protein